MVCGRLSTYRWRNAMLQGLTANVTISVRSSEGSPALLAPRVAAALTGVDRNLTFTFRPLQDRVDASLTQERLVALVTGFFGTLALLLAGLGLYGVTSYAVTRRRAEIGIRMALGAEPAGVVRLVLVRVFVLVALGVIIGTAVSCGHHNLSRVSCTTSSRATRSHW